MFPVDILLMEQCYIPRWTHLYFPTYSYYVVDMVKL